MSATTDLIDYLYTTSRNKGVLTREDRLVSIAQEDFFGSSRDYFYIDGVGLVYAIESQYVEPSWQSEAQKNSLAHKRTRLKVTAYTEEALGSDKWNSNSDGSTYIANYKQWRSQKPVVQDRWFNINLTQPCIAYLQSLGLFLDKQVGDNIAGISYPYSNIGTIDLSIAFTCIAAEMVITVDSPNPEYISLYCPTTGENFLFTSGVPFEVPYSFIGRQIQLTGEYYNASLGYSEWYEFTLVNITFKPRTGTWIDIKDGSYPLFNGARVEIKLPNVDEYEFAFLRIVADDLSDIICLVVITEESWTLNTLKTIPATRSTIIRSKTGKIVYDTITAIQAWQVN